MALSWEGFQAALQSFAPPGTAKRKLLQILSIILFFEGISVMLLFSKIGLLFGIFSLALGVFLMLIFFPGRPSERELPEAPGEPRPEMPVEDSYGMKIVEGIVDRIGGPFVLSLLGVVTIVLVFVWNFAYSARPELGDLDTLSLLFGGLLVVYPWLSKAFRLEAMFALIFLALVVVLLVVPQAIVALSSDSTSGVGNWYVHYMLAAPFAGILDLIGIPATSQGNIVTLELQDGTVQRLGISAYCAGLYSFSIFVSAFVSFVLVFERLPAKLLAVVLGLGLLAAYLGNLFRMVVIGIIGYYEGVKALLWAHENAGWIIFLGWSAVFWYLLLRYTSKRSSQVSAPLKGD